MRSAQPAVSYGCSYCWIHFTNKGLWPECVQLLGIDEMMIAVQREGDKNVRAADSAELAEKDGRKQIETQYLKWY